ncbi:MAG: translation initiation factor IF-2 [Bacillota bacterium]|nr:translation initiation factor IF-2 [Bacillota bacterium]
MDKVRVYELAKELNTTSKRLTEKLAEINIHVKNHMSLLSDEELSALYNHIGIIKQDKAKKAEAEEKKVAPSIINNHGINSNPISYAGVDAKDKTKKDAKQAPRIIRKTEIIIDTKTETKDEKVISTQNTAKNSITREPSNRDNRNQRNGFIRSTESNSGLRAGYVRNTGSEYINDVKVHNSKSNYHSDGLKNEDSKNNFKHDSRNISNQDAKSAVKTPEATMEVKNSLKNDTVFEASTSVKSAQTQEQVKQPDISEADRVVEKRATEENIKNEVNKNNVEVSPKVNVSEIRDTSGTEKIESKMDKEVMSQLTNEQTKTEEIKPDAQIQVSSDESGGDKQEVKTFNRPNDRPFRSNDRQNNRPNDRPYNRPNDRPNDRPYNRPNDRPNDRPYNRPNDKQFTGSGDNKPNDRPYNRPNDRPFNNRPNDRPYNKPNDKPFNRPNDRPYNRPNDRPYNRPNDNNNNNNNNNNRPYNKPNDNRPFNRPNDRPNNRQGDKGQFLDIPKPEFTAAQKEEFSARNETKREFQNKDFDKDVKRDQKKEAPRNQNNKNQRFKPQTVKLGEKKGVSEALSEDYILEEFYDNDGVKRSKRVSKQKRDVRGQTENKHIPRRAVLTQVKIRESISVKDLAETLKKTSTEVIKKLMVLGIMATLNHELDFDTAAIISEEFGIKAEKEVEVNEEDILFDESEIEDEKQLAPRPPVVVVMGHVDHGKTSLLDAIREADVVKGEAGGITQHIGAYTVKINNRNITFLDTPGHEAFTAMRARGAQVTDIAILVVAADDGVMPQTVEAINHAKAANVSIIVAINKIDKPGANPDRVKQELTEYGLVSEEWGGDTICVNVSAKKRMNIDGLLEMALLTADMQELKANPNRQAKGTIIEAKLDKDRGPIATMLVQRGTLKLGDSIVTGTTVGRIRAMVDDKGHNIKKAGPSTPVEILGLPEVPEAGETFYAITDEKIAKQLAEKRKLKLREQQLKASAKVSLDDLFNQIKEGKVKDLNIIVKADVQGSVEAVKQSLEKLSDDEVRVNIIHGGVGAIAESDVTLAQVSNAIIIGFNVRPGANVAEMAKDAGVDLRLYRVIYNAIEDIKAAMKGMLEPTFKEVVQGHTEIRQIFKVSGIGTIAGCHVTDGKVTRNSEVRIIRDGIVIFEGKLASLKRFKDDAKEVAQGFECGMSFEKFNDLKEGDIVESYIMEEVAR